MSPHIEPGCLAIIVGGHPANLGKEVRVLAGVARVEAGESFYFAGIRWGAEASGTIWHIIPLAGTLSVEGPAGDERDFPGLPMEEAFLLRIDGLGQQVNQETSHELH